MDTKKEMLDKFKSAEALVFAQGIHLSHAAAQEVWVTLLTLNQSTFFKAAKQYVTFKTAKTNRVEEVTQEMCFMLFKVIKSLADARVKAGKNPFANHREEEFFNDFSSTLFTGKVLKSITPAEAGLFENADASVSSSETAASGARTAQTYQTKQLQEKADPTLIPREEEEVSEV